MNTELLKKVYEAMSYGNAQDRESARLAVGAALAEQPAQQEPALFEHWYDKQFGGAEEIGFQQDLRIAYGAGQDSVTTPQAQRKPLTDEFLEALAEKHVTNCYFDTLAYARAIEAAHSIKENT